MFDVNMILWQEVYGWNSLICALRMYVSPALFRVYVC